MINVNTYIVLSKASARRIGILSNSVYATDTQIPRIRCIDGFSISVQTGYHNYCSPRTERATNYTEIEIGYPSHPLPSEFNEYADGHDPKTTHGVWAYVPIELVESLIASHGGISLEAMATNAFS